MFKIKIPNNNINERKYIIDILLGEFLGLDYLVTVDSDNDSWDIVLENGNNLIIEDHFFNKFSKELEYLKEENIPKKVEFSKNDFIVENDIPIIYGIDKVSVNSDSRQANTVAICCGIDIFASSFFMLTRWEEYVNKTRDKHNRFPAIESLAYKNNFLNRPVVNEYVEMLWNMLNFLGCKQERKKREFKLVLTHDVDEIKLWKSWKQVFRVMIGDVLKRKDLFLAFERFAEYFLIKRGKIKDPFDMFEWLMDKSEAVGVKSRFYFMSGGFTEYDNRYKIDSIEVLELIDKIKQRGHIIGIHPSYNAYNNFEQFQKEKVLLEQTVREKIVEGREHYLRFEVPTTWQIWEDSGMRVDSTCGYADKEGFRCGTGDEFSVFNILTREKLKLKERPLIFMDDNRMSGERIYNNKLLIQNIKRLQKQSMKFQMKFTVLFHQSIFALKDINYKDIYEKVIN